MPVIVSHGMVSLGFKTISLASQFYPLFPVQKGRHRSGGRGTDLTLTFIHNNTVFVCMLQIPLHLGLWTLVQFKTYKDVLVGNVFRHLWISRLLPLCCPVLRGWPSLHSICPLKMPGAGGARGMLALCRAASSNPGKVTALYPLTKAPTVVHCYFSVFLN